MTEIEKRIAETDEHLRPHAPDACMALRKERAEWRREVEWKDVQIKELRALVAQLGKEIAEESILLHDHACEQCVPSGLALIEGFTCARHRALAIAKEAPCSPT